MTKKKRAKDFLFLQIHTFLKKKIEKKSKKTIPILQTNS